MRHYKISSLKTVSNLFNPMRSKIKGQLGSTFLLVYIKLKVPDVFRAPLTSVRRWWKAGESLKSHKQSRKLKFHTADTACLSSRAPSEFWGGVVGGSCSEHCQSLGLVKIKHSSTVLLSYPCTRGHQVHPYCPACSGSL